MFKQFLIGCALFSAQAFAGWQFSPAQSDLSFVSIKKNTIAEVHHFKRFDAQLSESGELAVTIDLASVETMIPIRNERMRDMLFNVAKFPTAVVKAEVAKTLQALKFGTQQVNSVSATLTLNGETQPLSLDLQITKSKQGLHIVPIRAVIVNANQFGLGDGIEALRKIAGLDSIATSVPVNFQLVFDAKP
ncbi:YceI family protein [Pseudoalteromonas sp. T1lg65]|uniref:YceI family protein n=1 Tax=Pseudoalteromonas sp. T1lg65 TaxID=2077101 RepID=UPI003F7AD490